MFFIGTWNEWTRRNLNEPDKPLEQSLSKALKQSRTEQMSSQTNIFNEKEFLYQRQGWCPVCESETTFTARNPWLRDHYLCSGCSSIPRERALMHVIQTRYTNWRKLNIHESSPAGRGASVKLRSQSQNYTETQYDLAMRFGETHPEHRYRSEDLENQTFEDAVFDIVITQDVMEHVFDAEAVFREIHRTLKPGGAHIFTTPLVNKSKTSQRRAKRRQDGSVVHLFPPEYHGNPMSEQGSLVTWHWGWDIIDVMKKTCCCQAYLDPGGDAMMGIEGEYLEVVVQIKTD